MSTFDTSITVIDERSISIPNAKLSAADTEQIGKWIANNAQEGYGVKSVAAITVERGTQRDPYTQTNGVKITLERKS